MFSKIDDETILQRLETKALNLKKKSSFNVIILLPIVTQFRLLGFVPNKVLYCIAFAKKLSCIVI